MVLAMKEIGRGKPFCLVCLFVCLFGGEALLRGLTAQLGAPPHHCAAALLARVARTKDFAVMIIIIRVVLGGCLCEIVFAVDDRH